MHGYHHDIKPRNILIRGSDFILADFGLSRLKEIDEDTKTPWKDTTFEYGAPECRDPQSFVPGMVSRAIDIWSVGCVFSEIAAYMEKGSQGVSDFREWRVIEGEYGKMRCFHDGESLSSNADRYLEEIAEQACSTSMKNLILLIRRTLFRHAMNRPKADEVERELFHFAIEALLDILLHTIEHSIDDGEVSMDQNLFRTWVSLEENRLLAWADCLGLRPIQDRVKKYDRQVDILAFGFYETVKSAFDALASKRHFETPTDNQDFKLNVLRQVNDELCKHLSEETRLSIDNIFYIITAHKSTLQSLRQISAFNVVVEQENDVSATAAMKYMSLLLERQTQEPAENCRIEASLMRQDSSKIDSAVRPETWFYSYGHQQGEERKAIVEFVPYWERKIKDSRSQEFHIAVEAMFRRVQELVSMLKLVPKPPGFRVLNCLGTFHDSQRRRFALVYAFPSENTLPVRLNKLLRHGKSCVIYPDLGEKLALAKSLTACVQSFHTSGWIHKNNSSLNVLFFPETESDWNTVKLSEPYIVGFDHSRKDNKGEYSQGPILSTVSQEYLHPQYRSRSTRAKRSYDYYSLGLVLLEIGLWSSISNIYDQNRYQTYSPSELREEYIKLCDRSLSKAMGSIYQRVTKTCLQYGSGMDDLGEQLDFQTEVVDRLNMCVF
jgi:serine/threonine protein kinase